MSTLTAPQAGPRSSRHRSEAPRGRAVRAGRAGRPARRIVRITASLLLLAALAAFAGLAVGPHLFGYRTATMLTGSMAPGIVPGDIVVAVQEPTSEVAVGDVITYHIPVEDHRVETHRVIEVQHAKDGSIAVRTQGDANDGADPWTATLDSDSVWQVKAVVPYVGDAIRALRTPVVGHSLMYGVPAILLIWMLSSIWRRPTD